MEERLTHALAAAARAFADSLDGSTVGNGSQPQPGSAESMRLILSSVADINDGKKRGVTEAEIAQFARRAGMDPRGTAGYYTVASQLLTMNEEGRWITKMGRDRLKKLENEA